MTSSPFILLLPIQRCIIIKCKNIESGEKMALFTKDRSFYRDMIRLAIPISLQSLITFLVNFADNLMIGSLGDYAISGVYMGNQIQTVLQLFVGAIDAAMLIMAAQYWGNKDILSVKKIAAVGLRLAVVVGLILTVFVRLFPAFTLSLLTPDAQVIQEGVSYLNYVALSYIFFCVSQLLVSSMRAVESAKVGMYIALVALCTNVSLNWILIFGHLGFPAMGVAGAGLATLISRIVEALAILLYVTRVDQKLKMTIKEMISLKDRLLVKDFFKYGLPVVGGNMIWAVNMLANSAIMGRLSAEAITAASTTNMLDNLITLWVFGLSAAVGIITGKTVGSGQFEKMKEYAKTTQIIFLLVGVVSSGIIFLIKEPFLSLYDISDGARAIGRQFMTVLIVSNLGRSYQATCLGGLVKAGGDTSFVFKNDTVFVLLVVIPSAVIATMLNAPAWVVFSCLKCDQILKCFVAVVKINSFNWMKKLVRENKEETA